jgi:hypothetical protein
MVPWADAVGVKRNKLASTAMTSARTPRRLATGLERVRMRMG